MLILLLFFCSGATALVYEVIWSKYLALMFGSTIQAQTVVLAVFMGGLALGNRIFGGRADRSRQPLVIYGYIELAIGLYAFFFSNIYQFADGLFISLGANLLDKTGWLLALKGTLAVALLLGPTILMGGTLPLLAAWLNRTSGDAGRRSARFYSTNSLGAVFGSFMAGFYLVEGLGMVGSLQLSALVNVVVGFTAVGLGRKQGALPAHAHVESATGALEIQNQNTNAGLFRWGGLLVALTGGVSMGLEVLASRCLCLIFGASLQAFAIVLMAFILGISLGAAVIASPRRKSWPREITVIVMLLTAAALIGLVVLNIEQLVEFYRYARSGLARSEMGYRYHQVIAAVMSIAVLGLPAAALGSVLPLWIRVVSEGAEMFGDRVGRLLTWNTVGAVIGVLLTGFVLMPQIGLRGSFGALALLLSVAALGIACVARKQVAATVALAVMVGAGVISVYGDESWRLVLSSGIFRKHETEVYRNAMADRRRDVKILFYEDAADATVSIEQGDIGVTNNQIKLRINGKVDASSHGDLSTQYLLAHLPLLMKPESKEVFVFGMGSGVTAGAALAFPIDHVTVAENCEPVLRAAKFFNPWNGGVLTDPRTRIWREDARTVLKLSRQKFDVIISEPSNPWMAGVGSVFSREFYQLAANKLTDGGIMVQWFHVYEMHEGIVMLVLRTFGQIFPNMEVWDTSEGDIILLGSKEPWVSSPEVWKKSFAHESVRSALAAIGIESPEGVWARQFASQRTAFAIAGEGAIQRDDFPVLEYEAPKAFYLGQSAHALFDYDERTWQSPLMSEEKSTALAGLKMDALKKIFGHDYTSVNIHLEAALRTRFAGENFGYLLAGRPMPDAFVGGEVKLSATDDPALAVRASLQQGDTAKARQILFDGLERSPGAEQLRYLARIMIREGTLKPEDLPTAPAK